MVSFRANLISTQYVAKKNNDNSYSNYPVSFVQLNDENKDEVMAVRKTSANWAYGDKFGGNIADCMLESFSTKPNDRVDKYFAITKQVDDFEKLRSEDILALALTTPSESGEECIDYIQVEPKYVSTLPEYTLGFKLPNFKAIGSAICDGIENLFKDKNICLFALKNIAPFYERRGYISQSEGPIIRMLLKR